ncbi:MAG: MotA/TolQ/ExbB proton channel family protein [Pirellulaceae bacterium]|nr:MotA/TolQ/ExbB proton channel family protein [Pirellulaceae bacterium]
MGLFSELLSRAYRFDYYCGDYYYHDNDSRALVFFVYDRLVAMEYDGDGLIKPAVSWGTQDIENRIGVRGGRFTRVNTVFSLAVGVLLAIGFYASLIPIDDSAFAAMFTRRGFTPYVIVGLTGWCLAIIFLKHRKLKLQKRTLALQIVPASSDFVLSVNTVGQVFDNMLAMVDEPKRFVLFNRIQIALSNLKNLGNVSDIDEILRSQSETDESTMETSYSLLRGFVWAIPILGFIGTVMGLSTAIGGFGEVLGNKSDVGEITASLKVVTGGLATAFETTLLALVCALCIQLAVTFLRKGEEEFLDECAEYCQRNIVANLRIMPFDTNENANES